MKRIDKLISESARRTLRQDRQIRDAISRTMPPEWVEALVFARLDNTDLHLTVSTAAWVTKLRFIQPRIRQAVVDAGYPCQRIRWHTGVATVPTERYSQRSSPTISPAAAHRLRSAAGCLEDGPLRESLLAIAARGDPPADPD